MWPLTPEKPTTRMPSVPTMQNNVVRRVIMVFGILLETVQYPLRRRHFSQQGIKSYAIKDKRGNLVTNLCFQHLDSLVIAGLAPAIHHLRNTLLKMDGCPGQARA